MAVSRECEQCNEVKRCRMYIDENIGAVIYMCMGCAQELGYHIAPTQRGVGPFVEKRP